MELVAAIGWVATALAVSFAWPQAIAAIRAPSVGGIAPSGQLLMVATAIAWTSYGVWLGDPIIVAANAAAGVAVVVTITVLLRAGHLRVVALVGTVGGVAALLGLGAWLVDGAVTGVLAAGLGVAMTIPQAMALRRGELPEGVSAATYGLLGATMGCWLLYGVLQRDLVIVAPNVLAMPVVAAVWVGLRRASADQI